MFVIVACDCRGPVVTKTTVDVYMYSSAGSCDSGVAGPGDPRSSFAKDVVTTIPAGHEVELMAESIVKLRFCYRARYLGEVGYVVGHCCEYEDWWLP